ncbi:hypothetical protein [Gramella sp. MAR_2010_147]|uniref:hypothetical protein n=1 Tax=Gramella sp. MAR_2010_147 TaxID=1250205 RepID=UPI00087BB033|nr:hypothetical protein [Gramella sp. MAR_2010_147]SDR76688.1 hypothetical protein SAMN04488553_0608 [Gramella sp. MAR_2010_147]
MLAQQAYILNTEEDYQQIDTVKDWIQNIHESGTFFHLSLKTLELMRRFSTLYTQVFDKDDIHPSTLNQLIITSRGLEVELIREN